MPIDVGPRVAECRHLTNFLSKHFKFPKNEKFIKFVSILTSYDVVQISLQFDEFFVKTFQIQKDETKRS